MEEQELKTCPICKYDKPLDEYYVRHSRRRADGSPCYQHGCKQCRRGQTRDWQSQHPERTRLIGRAASRRYYAKNREAIRLRTRKTQEAA